MRLFWISVMLAFAFVQPAQAHSCKDALDTPDNRDSGGETASAGKIFGDSIREIDGTWLATPEAMRTALKDRGDKVPLINGGDFHDWDFAGLKLPLANVCFYTSNLSGSEWDGVDYPGMGFIETNLTGANFTVAKLDGLLLRQPDLTDVLMTGTRLRGGTYDGGWGGVLTNWDLTDADMRGFKFDCGITVGDGCSLDRQGAKFIRADLTDADISPFVFWGGADYSGAKLAGTKIDPRQLPELAGAVVAAPVILAGGDENVELNADEVYELQRQHREAGKREANPSFACAEAASAVEKLICGEYEDELRRKDRQMADLYAMIRPKNPSIAEAQKKWLASRNACHDRDCLDARYKARIAAMLGMLGEPEVLKAGETALFIDETIAFPDAFRTSPLFRKITPVLIGASMGEVILERAADGSYAISGESVGGNAHLCSVGGDGLRFNAKTGWFSGPREDDPKLLAAIFRVFGDEMEFPGSGHPDEAEFPGSEWYASCGMRAVLGAMRRIDVSPELLAKHRAYFQSEGE